MSIQTSASASVHPIVITPAGSRVRVLAGGEVIADTARALSLEEASYPPVLYIPREDVRMNLLVRTDRHTHCPYKGDASYFSIVTPAGRRENAGWSYETPIAKVAPIAKYLAFYPDRVDAIEQV